MSILDVSVKSEDDYAFAAILLLDRIVRQGFANPRNVSNASGIDSIIIS